ncbi:MAG: alpha/beta hydrolase [Candidatus Omnitrophica bacterium]|nr:alpha/beta hydrolase [Candidatus Omnitrophota bacterium]
MRTFYIVFVAIIIFIIILVAVAFIVLERGKHQSIFYSVDIAGKNVGHVKIDRYKTEDKIIYKSTSFLPKKIKCKLDREKIVFNREDFELEKFSKECKTFGAMTDAVYIRTDGKTFDFLGRSGSKWSTVSGIAHARNTSVFDEASVVTYMPFVEKYNFNRGGAQSFNALHQSRGLLLPPAGGKVIFTSIRDEYINVDGRKIKTEVIVIKAKSLPQAHIWISKKDKSIARLRIGDKALVIKKVGSPRKITIHDYAIEKELYNSHEVLFPSGDIALAGTVEIPKKEGRLPSVLLVAGEGPYDRENAGLYTDISGELARSGYVVLRFDKRGIGKSQGNNTSQSLSDEINDIKSALKFLLNHEKVDKEKLFIVAHSDACSYLPTIDFSKFPVRGLVLLSVTKPSALLDFECQYVFDTVEAMKEIDKRYQKTLDLLKKETFNLIENTKKEYVSCLGKRVFTKRMAELLEFQPREGFEKLKLPLVIIQGKRDKMGSPLYIQHMVEKALSKIEEKQSSIVYFRGLGYFLGKIADRENEIKHYKTNKEVLETIRDWIGLRCVDDLTNA